MSKSPLLIQSFLQIMQQKRLSRAVKQQKFQETPCFNEKYYRSPSILKQYLFKSNYTKHVNKQFKTLSIGVSLNSKHMLA